ncbi:MAG: phosphoglycerate dehydrogenase [Deltaproteobacteria bacterium]|nr:phosphoglycerate dehydrogenase [Deltaproteobacteria bacterium]
MKILICDPLSEVGVQILRDAPDTHVDIKTGLTTEELKAVIGEYHGIIIRSATRLNADIIDAAKNLKVIGKAGTVLDNMDVNAASKKSIVVMNTPESNTITAAEHTIAMIMALSRNIPQATASLKAGKWEKEKFQGRELLNKILGIIGAGHIGQVVADRAKGMKMKVIVYDPYIKPESIEKMDLEPVSFEELLRRSDYISIHTPKNDETMNIINEKSIASMKPGVMIVNCAEGGIINEDDLFEALKSGHVGGAALDVFSTEPPGKLKLMDLPNFICTPHLGASTKEAQENMAREIADQVIAYLLFGTVKNAVNVPNVSEELMTTLRPYVILAEKMGAFQAQLAAGSITEVQIEYSGKVLDYDLSPLTTAILKGLMTPILKDEINFINASLIARERGIKVVESKTLTIEGFSSRIKLWVKSLESENIISGTIFGRTMPRIVRINDFYLEAIPEGHNLLIHNMDIPGVIGRIAMKLGERNVNISRMAVGQEKAEKQNVILLSTNIPVEDNILEELRMLENIFSVKRIEL